jgi:LemA protein
MKNVFRLFAGLLVVSMLSSCGYNSMVQKREAVNKAWGNVQSSYQRRSDLIQNLVNTVKGAANFEQTTLTQVIEARNKTAELKLSPDDLTKENLQKFQQVQDELKNSYSRMLNVVVERYPELKATENFQELQAQIEGTENRINTERNRFNEAVQDYNAYIASFPQLAFAKMFGFSSRAYFESAPGAEKAPVVDVSDKDKK